MQKILGEKLLRKYSDMHALLLKFADYSKKEGRTSVRMQDIVDGVMGMVNLEK